MNPRPSASWIAENASKPEDEQLPETYMVESSFMHHAIAWTIADIARACASTGNTVRLLTQDPNYSAERKETLQKVGWEVVREHGAGGFAELDDESIVFSPFTSAPVKQIIADLARPVAIISAESSGGVFNRFGEPYSDPESPRTKQMWKEYESWKFPVSSKDVELAGSLRQLKIYARKRECIVNQS